MCPLLTPSPLLHPGAFTYVPVQPYIQWVLRVQDDSDPNGIDVRDMQPHLSSLHSPLVVV